MTREQFEDLKFQIEVSTRYHEWRRATFLRWGAVVKFLSIVGAFLAFAFLWSAPNYSISLPAVFDLTMSVNTAVIVSVLSAAIAFVNIMDLVFDYSGKAAIHGELYKQFKGLQERIARQQGEWEQLIHDWEADAQVIRLGEPPMKWAVYALCWNQTAKRFGFGQLRKVGPIKRLLRNVYAYSPQDFPEGAAV